MIKHIHFIAIGGQSMHNLAITLKNNGYNISGSDHEIYDPSHGNLALHDLLPERLGWFPERITNEIDAVIVGGHIDPENPELKKAKELNLPLYSYPEFIYEFSKNKNRVVIAGSYGKNTITSIVMHVLSYYDIEFDYLVSSPVFGHEGIIRLSKTANIIIIEGDEDVTSTIDNRSKFEHYKPHIALLSGIGWSHVNTFPTFEAYVTKFKKYLGSIEKGGKLIYSAEDKTVEKLVNETPPAIKKIPFRYHPYEVFNNKTFLKILGGRILVNIFGKHNMYNIEGAIKLCQFLKISSERFYQAIRSYKGTSKHLQLLGKTDTVNVYLDYAYSPAKLSATIKAIREQYSQRELVVFLELCSIQNFNTSFLQEYKGTMNLADEKIIYFNPETIYHQSGISLDENQIKEAFGSNLIKVYTTLDDIKSELYMINWTHKNFLLMSSDSVSGLHFTEIAKKIIALSD
ncbi:MAG: Mur ligase domain-containing protein [Bacteroidales bacterium]|nr:Mur ligase domain-containing protein [Bacteroidales bacterium]NLK81307.1 peptidoglycan synthetase [Bacteroidales bacterium]